MGVLTAEEIENYTQMFHYFDSGERDGKMSFPELVYMIRQMGYSDKVYSDQDLAGMFLEFDTDGSKSLSLEEFIAVFNKRPRSEIDDASIRKIFRDLDKDQSGTITASELKEALEKKGGKCSDKDIDGMIAECDPSGDGVISEEEFMALWGK